jgi:hypothetical protein
VNDNMAVFVQGTDIGSSWIAAYGQLQPTGHAVNLAVSIDQPLREDLGVRRAIEAELVRLRDVDPGGHFKHPQSMHTVANTIFPVGLYRPGSENAAQRFFDNALRVEQQRSRARHRQWGTYIGRLVAYPSPNGTSTNQLQAALMVLNANRKYKDRYEIPLLTPQDSHADVLTTGALLHGDSATDGFRAQGGPCLAHLSLTSFEEQLSMVALYRAHEYETRAYGNFLGLARLLSFLATESGKSVGNLLVVASHAWAAAPSRAPLVEAARAASGDTTDIETHARPLGATLRDLDLPGRPR